MKSTLLLFAFFFGLILNSQSEDIKAISATLMDYIEGTSNGEPDRISKAFHSDLNLYSIRNDSLKVWNGKNYISSFKKGESSNRVGRILSIDLENNAAMAKAEIFMSNRRRYTDYFLLLKINGTWKIIHKIYTWREYI